MDTKQRIENAKANLRKAESARTVAQTQAKAAEEQLQEVGNEMKEYGVTPETISDEITTLEGQITADLDKIESLMPVI